VGAPLTSTSASRGENANCPRGPLNRSGLIYESIDVNNQSINHEAAWLGGEQQPQGRSRVSACCALSCLTGNTAPASKAATLNPCEENSPVAHLDMMLPKAPALPDCAAASPGPSQRVAAVPQRGHGWQKGRPNLWPASCERRYMRMASVSMTTTYLRTQRAHLLGLAARGMCIMQVGTAAQPTRRRADNRQMMQWQANLLGTLGSRACQAER